MLDGQQITGLNATALRQARGALAADLLFQVAPEPDAADRYPHQFSGGQRQRL